MSGKVSSHTTFQYRSLRSKTAFRLIRLSDKQHKKYICLDLSEHEFEDFEQLTEDENGAQYSLRRGGRGIGSLRKYTALSYHWQDSTPARIIRVNKFEIWVHQTLWRFLRQLLREDDRSFYWTDALCINQEDDAERGHQVSYMDQIFSRASKVVAWLSHQAIYERYLLVIAGRTNDATYLDARNKKISKQAAISGISTLDYWRRAWIVQEIALARHVELKCGGVRISLDLFQTYLSLYSGKLVSSGYFNTHCEQLLQHVADFKYTRAGDGIPDLWAWLYNLRDLQCRDELDQIYSLFGLARSLPSDRRGKWPLLRIDYTKSLTFVILDWFFMNLTCSIRIRNSAGIQDILLQEAGMLSLCEVLNFLGACRTGSEAQSLTPDMVQQLHACLEEYMRNHKNQEEFRWMARCFNTTLVAMNTPEVLPHWYGQRLIPVPRDTPKLWLYHDDEQPHFLSWGSLNPVSANDYRRNLPQSSSTMKSRVYCRDKDTDPRFYETFSPRNTTTYSVLKWCLGCTDLTCPGELSEKRASLTSRQLKDSQTRILSMEYLDSDLCQNCRSLCQSYFSTEFHSKCRKCKSIYQSCFTAPSCDKCPEFSSSQLTVLDEEDTDTKKSLPNCEWPCDLNFSVQLQSSGPAELNISYGCFGSPASLPVVRWIYYVERWSQTVRLYENFLERQRMDHQDKEWDAIGVFWSSLMAQYKKRLDSL